MDYFLFFVFLIVILISILLVWFNLPGTFIFLCFIFGISFSSLFKVITNKDLIFFLVLFIFLEFLEFILAALIIKIYGGKKSTAFISLAGGILGGVIGNFIIPIIGGFFGLIICSYLITYFNERRIGKSQKKAFKIANNSTLGYIFAKGLKTLSIIFIGIYLISHI